jgi:hypothetical protein
MNIPWIAAGPAVRAGHSIRRQVSIKDTAPTLTRILGIDAHPAWEGLVVDEIFHE